MKNTITQNEVSDFKSNSCNENTIIVDLIKAQLLPYFIEPILDVGAGLGDIAYRALFDKHVIGIDTNDIPKDQFPLSNNHQRLQANFFDYFPETTINTIFICHALQFLDEDVDCLNEKANRLNPKTIIAVTNDNNDFLGEIVDWTKANYLQGNPEIQLDFPRNYQLEKKIPFQVEVICNDFTELAKQVSYLMLIDHSDTTNKLKSFLMENLSKPQFVFNQSICVYTR